jgi:two-component system OmpR family sensor kinase
MKAIKPVSLFGRLLLGFVVVMLLIWAGALARIAYQAKVDQLRTTAIVNKGWTRQILLNVASVAGQPDEIRRIGAAIERLRLDMFDELGFQTQARTQVWKGQTLIYRSDPGYVAAFPLAAGASGDAPDDWASWVERDAASGITVWRSERINGDWIFTPSAAGYLLTPLAYSLPFLLLPAWFIVRLGLRPLRSMVKAIEARSAADLAPLPESPYRELAPLTGAINHLMKRLTERLAREQEFLSDAAHELKTPLSVIQINAHRLAASCAGGGSERGVQASEGLRDGVARASHTVHQLLAYERARSERGDAAAPPIDLLGLLRERLARAVPLAGARGIDIELAASASAILPLHRESMAALLDNVIGNAIKYSPDGGRISACLVRGPEGTRIGIEDQGPGIAPALRRKVFERFYRIPGQDTAGSGLGLAIAERAAARNGATIRIGEGENGKGALVTIEFAAAPPD